MTHQRVTWSVFLLVLGFSFNITLAKISYEVGVCQGKQSMCKILNTIVWKEQQIVGMGENPGQVWVVQAGEMSQERRSGEQVDQKEDQSEDSAAEAKASQYLEPMAKLLFRI